MIDLCREKNAETLLDDPDVAERVALYRESFAPFRKQLGTISESHGPLVVIDFRNQPDPRPGNRFLVYALFPEAELSMHILDGPRPDTVKFAVGKSILNRGSPVDVGALMLEYGGGGHKAAGACRVPEEEAERVRDELIARLSRQGEKR